MRKPLVATLAAVVLASMPVMASTAYADASDGSTVASDTVTPLDDSNQQSQMGPQTDVLRPGADPNDPSQYAFLPKDQQAPAPGPRTDVPAGPQVASGSSTGSNALSGGTVSSNAGTPGTLPDLAVGKPYKIGTQWPDATFAGSEAHYANTGQLTDGNVASLSFSDKGWVGLLRQNGRSVTVDLGSVQNVQRVSLDFLQNLGAGIDFPDSVTYYASVDDQNWYPIGKAWSSKGGGDYTPQSQAFQVDTNMNAQYIRAQFDDKVFTFLDEFSVYGSQNPDQGAKPLVGRGQDLTQLMGNDYLVDPTVDQLPDVALASAFVNPPADRGAPAPSGYLTPSDPGTGGVNNMQLVYTGANGAIGSWSESDFLPMIASEDVSGKPQGWMFDTTLFGPYSAQTPTSTAGWSAWLADLFSSNTELSALDQAVGSLKQQLNDPNFKEKVVITIPGLSSNPSNFGAIDSSGTNMDLNPKDVGAVTALENKVKAIDWYMQQFMSQWNNANFANLSLVGFYWSPESLNVTDPYDPELIQATSYLVHRDHLYFYWIPYYGAPGIAQWNQLGFDNVMIQPGVSFNWGLNASTRLQSTAQQGQYYHTGLEMEQHWDVVSTVAHLAQTAQNKYFDYFSGGYVYGYEQNVMKSWYLNSKTLLQAYQLTNPFYHQVYDNTVEFVDGNWKQTSFQ